MKIKKENNKIIVEIPLTQEGESQWGNEWKVPNVVGFVANEKGMDICRIHQLNYLDYKDSLQLGMELISFWGEPKEFIKLCDTLGIAVWEYPSCHKCGEIIYGSHTSDDNSKPICFKCEKDEK